jgi:hypothetical protein
MRCYVIIRYISKHVACHGVIGVLFGLLATIFVPFPHRKGLPSRCDFTDSSFLLKNFRKLQIIVSLDVKRPMKLKICIFVSGINAVILITLFIEY